MQQIFLQDQRITEIDLDNWYSRHKSEHRIVVTTFYALIFISYILHPMLILFK